MNVETGQIYQGEEEIRKARERGELIREMTEEEIREHKSRVRHSYEQRSFGLKAHKDRSGSKPKYRGEKTKAARKKARKTRSANRSR